MCFVFPPVTASVIVDKHSLSVSNMAQYVCQLTREAHCAHSTQLLFKPVIWKPARVRVLLVNLILKHTLAVHVQCNARHAYPKRVPLHILGF